ncbi:MAG: hypothetical protein M1358_09980 [Chloroflexi bacterium]|nr:hypothetical protein [Chloroflexota bacterium]
MNGGIFLIKGDDQLVEMKEQTYDSEDVLQTLLAKYPNLLAGDQMDSSAPRRWLLISREAALPSEEGGAGRWAIDHLFLDQDAIPTLVEVKRSSDRRIRREVVGQMLDYAANAVVYWPVETIRAQFEMTCAGWRRDPSEEVLRFLGEGADAEQFWQEAKTNLQAGRIRLVFVADTIPDELQRVVEFLNGQMDPAEVLAVEVRLYTGQDLKTLVPRVIGQTAEAQQKKRPPRGISQWDEPSFLRELEKRKGSEQTEVARKLLDWAKSKELRIWWGKGKKDGSFFPILDREDLGYWLFSAWTYGRIEIQFEMMRARPVFDDESKRLELLRRLNEIRGVAIPAGAIGTRPSIPMSTLADESVLDQFLAAFDWVIQEIEKL